jgi:flavin reductase (DIM6/NTAB) family NADH-FMN oxidoreductase RutF
MITIDPGETPLAKIHSLFQGVIVPRPIALASTIDKEGNINLSPFSFFNIFSLRPPVLIFSPSRRGRNNTQKHSYENILEVPEVVINIVTYSMVEQASLASVDYPKGVNEFRKTGLTPVESMKVKPPRVGESPASFECVVKQVISLGDLGGAGNLVICEVVLAHLKEEIVDDQGRIDPQKVDAVGRMGNDYYCRAHGENIFIVPKPHEKVPVGLDQIPEAVLKSKILTGNDLGRLGNIEKLPDAEEIEKVKGHPDVQRALQEGEESVHRLAQKIIRENRMEEAWKVLMAFYL